MTKKKEAKPEKKSPRLRSLDALRGFDMFWIVGGYTLIAKLAVLTEWSGLVWLQHQLHHSRWIGFTFYDLIFPLFLFLAGVAMPYSLGRRQEAGESKLRLLRKVAIRVFMLVLLGAIYNGALAFRPLAETRLCSVLGFIGLAYGGAALIYLNCNLRHQIIWTVGILLGSWAALVWINVPGHGSGVLTPEGCVTGYLDRNLFPWRLNNPNFDPEGLLPTIHAIATALLGVLTGQFLRGKRFSGLHKGLLLLAAGLVGLGLAWLLGLSLPIAKKMWTSTFILHCAGWSLLFLGVFYLVIDVLGCWRWSYFFIIIGLNPITIYLGSRMVDLHHTSNFFFGGLVGKFDEPLRGVLGALAYITTWWLVLLFLHRKKIYLRV